MNRLYQVLLGLMTVLVAFFLYISVRYDVVYEGQTEVRDMITSASEDASTSLMIALDSDSIEVQGEGVLSNYENINLNLNGALDRFYRSLYNSYGVLGDEVSEQQVKFSCPVKLVVGYDGYYICSFVEDKDASGNTIVVDSWSPKYPYSITDEVTGYDIYLTLDSDVYVDKKDGLGTKKYIYSDVASMFSSNKLFGPDFVNMKSDYITAMVNKKLEDAINNSNSSRYINSKLSYTINLPTLENRSLRSVAFIGFLQGNESFGVSHTNPVFGLGVTKIVKREKFYGTNIGGIKHYHRKDCTDNINSNKIFDSMKEGAENGYSPCNKCFGSQ